MFILNPHSGVPIYRQIVEQVRRLVASGRLSAGSAMPSVREVAVEQAVNPMTISKAYSLLEAEGLLVRNRGKPMTVAGRPRKQALVPERMQQLDRQIDELVLAARQLRLSRRDLLMSITRKWENEDE